MKTATIHALLLLDPDILNENLIGEFVIFEIDSFEEREEFARAWDNNRAGSSLRETS